MASLFDVKLRGLPNQDLVVGFPGISATGPRLEGCIEIRSKDTTSTAIMSLVYVAIALYRTDCIHPPSNKPKPGIAIPKRDQSYLIGDKLVLFDTKGKSHDLIGMDLPFVLPLPTNRTLPASISLGKGTAAVQTTYQLFVSIMHGGSSGTTSSSASSGTNALTYHIPFPVRIKRYDTLSTFGAYRVPIVLNVSSADHLVTIDFSSPTSSFGPGDLIVAYLSIRPNPDWPKSRKIKLQRLTMQIVEIVQFDMGSGSGDDEPLVRRRRLAKCAKQLDLKLLQTEPYSCDMSLELPNADLFDKGGPVAIVPKARQDVPLVCCRNGFTTTAALYQVKYVLIIKARFSHCKDVTIEQPITVTPFDHVTCMSFMKSIADAVNQVNRADKHTTPPPKLYRSSDQSDLWLMGRMPSTLPGSKVSNAILLN